LHGLLYQLGGALLYHLRRALLLREIFLLQAHDLVVQLHLHGPGYEGLVAGDPEVLNLGLRVGYEGVADGLRLGFLQCKLF
jgi:hypothetical protein